MPLTIRDLPPGDPAWDTAFDVLAELHQDLDRGVFDEVHIQGSTQGLVFTGAFDDDGACLGVVGWRVLHTAKFTRKLFIDDLSVTRRQRSSGVGSALLAHLTERAGHLRCTAIDLDCATHRTDAHRFYEREGMYVTARHYRLPLSGGG